MVDITFKGIRRRCTPGETVLDCLRRHDVEVPSSCRAGVCQTCVLQTVRGTPPEAAQRGLSEALQRTGHVLACRCVPTEDLELAPPGSVISSSAATVIDKTALAPGVLRIRLRCEEPFAYRGGQFIHVVRGDGLIRSFSLASVPRDEFLELHVRRIRGGKMSAWMHDELKVGDVVTVRGPAGECFYAPARKDQPMLLAGTGTGAAPLWAILRDATAHEHSGTIVFFHGASDEKQLYLDRPLREMCSRHPNVVYKPVVAGRESTPACVERAVMSAIPNPQGWKIALCGAPAAVQGLTTRLYLAGASLADISADPFVPAEGRR